jgi:hypothetical protein
MHPYHELMDAARRGEAHARELAKRSVYRERWLEIAEECAERAKELEEKARQWLKRHTP